MDAFLENNIKFVGVNIKPQTRIVINNVLTFLNEIEKHPEKLQEIDFNQSKELAAKICGVRLATLDIIKNNPGVEQHRPRRIIPNPTTIAELNDFDKSVVKQIVKSIFERGEKPTIRKITEEARERIEGLQCSPRTMKTILSDIGYKYKPSSNGRKQLKERRRVVCARIKFLKAMKEFKDSGDTRPRIYLDETWFDLNPTRKRAWYQTRNMNIWRGRKLIVCHAGCAKYGFLPDTEWIFEAKKSKNGDHHSDMNSRKFTDWFERLLLSLEEPSLIIMDHASYRAKQVNRAPTSASTIEEIRVWLQNTKVEFNDTDHKEELLHKVQQNKGEKLYVLDQMAYMHGHEVLRMPSFHSQYNPIDLVWAKVKEEVATIITTEPSNIEQLVREAIANVSKEDWVKFVEQAEKLQDEDLKMMQNNN